MGSGFRVQVGRLEFVLSPGGALGRAKLCKGGSMGIIVHNYRAYLMGY